MNDNARLLGQTYLRDQEVAESLPLHTGNTAKS